MPKIGVVAPVYNCESYLRDFVDSVLNQSFKDFELILVDDGCTDGGGKTIDEFAARDVRVVAIHQKNGGQSAARNAGLDVASREFAYIADSGDILNPSLLETVVPRFDEGYELVTFGFKTIPDGEFLDLQHREAP